jgi:hypothetical protein
MLLTILLLACRRFSGLVVVTSSERAPLAFSSYSLRLLEASRDASARGLRFRDLAIDCLNEMLGETGACATIASVGRDSLDDPNVLARRIETLFGFGGRTILNGFIAYAEKKARIDSAGFCW